MLISPKRDESQLHTTMEMGIMALHEEYGNDVGIECNPGMGSSCPEEEKNGQNALGMCKRGESSCGSLRTAPMHNCYSATRLV
mmetsp:Transcript_5999/g.22729  ORF Transcript_5999/g.22729 Transcript_5999/m.22729 type:complete len:83 (+) Transcript_5999:1006-1254(+)